MRSASVTVCVCVCECKCLCIYNTPTYVCYLCICSCLMRTQRLLFFFICSHMPNTFCNMMQTAVLVALAAESSAFYTTIWCWFCMVNIWWSYGPVSKGNYIKEQKPRRKQSDFYLSLTETLNLIMRLKKNVPFLQREWKYNIRFLNLIN